MTSQPRQALGRGLSALIPKTGTAPGIETVDIDLIVPNPEQPRTRFDPDALQELAESIREHGVLQPVIVTQVRSELGPPTYQLIAGERRVQAARVAGMARMPVVVREAAPQELLELALVENLQRQDLNPIEEANAFRRLNDDFGLTQERISERVGRSRTSVANILRLLTLDDDIRSSLASGQISEGHGRALLQIDDPPLRLDAWRRIVADAMTVRQAEEIARALKLTSGTLPPAPPAEPRETARRDPHVEAVEADLREALGLPVVVRRSRRGGRVTIRFHSDAELEAIIERIVQ